MFLEILLFSKLFGWDKVPLQRLESVAGRPQERHWGSHRRLTRRGSIGLTKNYLVEMCTHGT